VFIFINYHSGRRSGRSGRKSAFLAKIIAKMLAFGTKILYLCKPF
jgi:hypothetical protein